MEKDVLVIRTLYDVQQLLKRFNIYVYVGDRLWDIELMMIELRQLKEADVISKEEFIRAMLVLKQEHRLEEKYKEGL